MTDQTSTLYDPVVKMICHFTDLDGETSQTEVWTDTLSKLFADWNKNGTDCEEQTGESEAEIRDELQANGSYQIDGFVGLFFVLHVVQ